MSLWFKGHVTPRPLVHCNNRLRSYNYAQDMCQRAYLVNRAWSDKIGIMHTY